MRKSLYLIGTILLIFLASESALAQMNRKNIKRNNKKISSYRGKKEWFSKEKRYNTLGIGLTALNYYGDLAPKPTQFSTDISFTRPAVSLNFSHRFGPRYTIAAAFMYGTLRGADSESANSGDLNNGVYRYQRNLSFRNRIKELSVVASLDLFSNMATYISRVKWTPYVFMGVAGLLHNPQALAPATDLNGNPLPEAGTWVNLQSLGTEGQKGTLSEGDVNNGIKSYKKLQVAIPFGIGARFRLNEVLDLSAELGFRYLFTDYIDDVSQNYVDLGVFGDNELAKAMSYRTNEIVDPNLLTPTQTRDGKTYNLLSGYGQEYIDNKRGNKNDKDTYMVTTIKLTYILGKTFHRAKFR
ncbi:DUF6089 family protein [Chryseolinea sp. H1M3-3]|uniref:DUF6089 family protein n=1 Tax=Chryseolinea sp. H1M3-3 TaxID=3034144 RepID=UPI0023EBA283|nr:DUF6089 family protein [Chryseolinea sp. H1M3-3]